jgi:hypothetical protein
VEQELNNPVIQFPPEHFMFPDAKALIINEVRPDRSGGNGITQLEAITPTANLSICQVRQKIACRAFCGMVWKTTKRIQAIVPPFMTTFYTYFQPTPAPQSASAPDGFLCSSTALRRAGR